MQHEPQQSFAAEDLEELRAQIAIGIEQADRGEVVDWNAEGIWAEVERCCAAEQRESSD